MATEGYFPNFYSQGDTPHPLIPEPLVSSHSSPLPQIKYTYLFNIRTTQTLDCTQMTQSESITNVGGLTSVKTCTVEKRLFVYSCIQNQLIKLEKVDK